jgi:hypothetical protein
LIGLGAFHRRWRRRKFVGEIFVDEMHLNRPDRVGVKRPIVKSKNLICNNSTHNHKENEQLNFRYLQKAGISGHIPALKQGLTDEQKNTRLQFARNYLDYDWSNVVFTDEKVFQNEVFVKKTLYRRKNTRFEEQ